MAQHAMIYDILAVIGWFGVVSFAISGALVASRKELDIIAFVLFGTVTGIGGGTFRDLVLGHVPVFWVKQPSYLVVCALVSAATFFLAHLAESRLKLLLWLDAAGMAIFCVLGAQAAETHGVAVALTCGVITSVAGGFVRDMLGAEVPVILRGEIYATAGLAGAAVYLMASQYLPRDVAVLFGASLAFTLRGMAIRFHWRLPVYRPRPGRRPEDLGL
jgi:uncharacterized membrane protein YeiH